MSARVNSGPIMRARIDYGFGVALLWGPFTSDDIQAQFYEYANQCFGIRKSISGFLLLDLTADTFPEVFGVRANRIAVVLRHNGDTIVWGRSGKKLKSEFDR